MEYRQLGRSGLQVSCVSLGANNFGDVIDERQSAAVIHKAVDLGVNYVDTSNSYGDGLSEDYIGRAVRGIRDQVIIATKFARLGHISHVRQPSRPTLMEGASRQDVIREAEKSLRHLGTDYIDVLIVHFWDPYTPIEETLRALDDLVRQGKVRYIGCSGFGGWHVCEAVWTSRVMRLVPFVVAMEEYNLLHRDPEKELLPACQTYGVGIVPFYPLASGFLAGKYRRGQPTPPGTRLAATEAAVQEDWTPRRKHFLSIVGDHLQHKMTEGNFLLVERLEAVARERGHTLAELALAWLLANPVVSAVVPGATRPEQVEANVKAGEWRLTAEDLAAVEKCFETDG